MNRFLSWLGKEHFSVPKEDLTALYNLFLCESFSFSEFWQGEENADFWVLSMDSRRLQKKAAERGIQLKKLGGKGLPALFLRYRRRLGLILGTILAAFILVVSTFFIWDLRIEGNERVSSEKIEELLRENGLYVGAKRSGIKAGELENRTLLSTGEIAWISVNLQGTVAYVQVTEAVLPPAEEPKQPANLVASVDGQIELVELYRGKSAVKIGQAVRAGDLLVSGISDNRNGGFFYTRASGRVLARTHRVVLIEIPFVAAEKTLTDEGVFEVSLQFFGLTAKIYKRTGKTDSGCVIIETEKGLSSLGLSRLPVSLAVKRFQRSEEVEITRDENQVLELAYAELELALESISKDAELLKKEIVTEWTDEGLRLTCSVDCIENIAKQVEFEILP